MGVCFSILDYFGLEAGFSSLLRLSLHLHAFLVPLVGWEAYVLAQNCHLEIKWCYVWTSSKPVELLDGSKDCNCNVRFSAEVDVLVVLLR